MDVLPQGSWIGRPSAARSSMVCLLRPVHERPQGPRSNVLDLGGVGREWDAKRNEQKHKIGAVDTSRAQLRDLVARGVERGDDHPGGAARGGDADHVGMQTRTINASARDEGDPITAAAASVTHRASPY